MGQKEGFKDLRQHARFELLEYAIVREKDSDSTVRSVVIDVSLGGLQVRSKHEFNLSSSYTLQIGRADSDPLEVDAEARYCVPIEDSDLFATGFRCLPTSSEDRMKWVDYVHSIFQSQGEHLVG
ncbi:MAG: PilZ domain-containing protein [Chthonomonadaceae bacterium]|nr:PilZ domain-containing protein [Chthonomonadaceae bacterium]